MREMKDSGVEWIGKIPITWKVSKLKYVFADGDEGLKIGPFGSAMKGKTLEEGPYKIYNQAHLIQNNFSLNRNFVSEETFNELKNYEVHPGDILFSMMGTIGKCQIMPEGFAKGIMDSHLLKSGIKKNINPRFLVYAYDKDYSDQAYNQLLYASNGTIMNGLNSSILKSVAIALPSKNEQDRIVEYLDSKSSKIDEIIAKQEQIIEKLKEYKLSVITEAVTKGLNPDVEMKDSEVEWIGDIPQGWETISLGMVSTDIRNGYVGPTREILVDSGIPYIQSLHVKDGKISFEKAEYFVSKEWGDKHPKVKEGQLVIVQTGDIGQVGLVEKHMDGFNCHALIILTLDRKKIHPNYLQYYLRSKPGKELMLQTSTGALLPHLNSGKVKSTTVLCPPVTEQMMIAEYLDAKCSSIDKTIDMESSLVQKACEYKKSLIYEVVTGKKEV